MVEMTDTKIDTAIERGRRAWESDRSDRTLPCLPPRSGQASYQSTCASCDGEHLMVGAGEGRRYFGRAASRLAAASLRRRSSSRRWA